MTVDYKGEFLLGNHRYCYPLTIVDHVTRTAAALVLRPSGNVADGQRNPVVVRT